MTPITPLIKEKKTPVFPIFVAATLGFQLLLFGMLLIQFIWLRTISTKPAPSLVQLVDGRAVKVTEADTMQRTSQTIKRFVSETMTVMFDWSGVLPPASIEEIKNPQRDPGVPIEGSTGRSFRLPTAGWQASFALSKSLRKPYIQKLASLIPSGVFSDNSGTQGLLIIRMMGEPKLIEEGKWKLDMISDLLIFTGQDQLGNRIAFNKEVYVQAVEPPVSPLEEASSPYQKVVYRARQSGLEIYKIVDLPDTP